MEHSSEITELAGALAKAQGAISPAKKDSQNPFFHSTYADLASVWGACRKPLSDNGLAVSQLLSNSEDKITMETILLHASGQWLSSTVSAKPVKDDPQGIGSLVTYLRRYALSAIVGVASDDDDVEQYLREIKGMVRQDTLNEVADYLSTCTFDSSVPGHKAVSCKTIELLRDGVVPGKAVLAK